NFQPAVDDHPQRLARRVDFPHREPRIIRRDRADAGEQRAGAGAPAVPVAPRLWTGDPLRGAVRERAATVERGGDLEANPRPAALHPRQEAEIELARLPLEQAMLEADARGRERVAAARRLRVGVAQRG